MDEKETTNEEFARLTQDMHWQEVANIFNTPNHLNIDRSNISNWRCTDKTKSQFRKMPLTTLELFKMKTGLI